MLDPKKHGGYMMKKLREKTESFVKRYFDVVGQSDIDTLRKAIERVNEAVIETMKDYVMTNNEFSEAYAVLVTEIQSKGLYDPKDNVICIHPAFSLYYFDLVDEDKDELINKLTTILHEHRHARQYTEEYKYMRKYEKYWKRCVLNKQLDEYWDNPLEVDARKYADIYAEEAFNYLLNNLENKLEEEMIMVEALYGAFNI